MKISSTFLFKGVVAFFMSAALLSSCGQEEPLPDDDNTVTDDPDKTPEEVVDHVADSLKTVLQRQVDAMTFLFSEEQVVLSRCDETDIEGLYEISFEGGRSFKLFSNIQSCAAILSYVEKDGAKYWAVYDSEGMLSELKNNSGSAMALTSSPDVEIVDGTYELVFGDLEFKLDFVKEDKVQAFGCEVLADADGEIYAVNFIFGEDKQVKLYVSTYSGAAFYLPEDDTRTPLSEYCVNWGTTVSLGLDIASGLEYKIVVSDGWKADKREENGVVLVDVTAPEKSDTAPTQGIVTVITTDDVLTLASLDVTTDPFTDLFASATNIVVTPSNGVNKFVYGVVEKKDYSMADIETKVDAWISGEEELPAASFLSETAVVRPFADVLGSELEENLEYVLWAATSSMLMSVDFTKIGADFIIEKTYLLDADIKVCVDGATAVFGGVIEKSDDFMTEVLYQINESVKDSIPVSGGRFCFEGLLTDFPALDEYKNDLQPASTYLLWVAPAVVGEYTYTEGDVFFVEVITNDFAAGSDLQLTLSEAQVTPSTISVPLSSQGAEMILYAFLNSSTGSRYSTAEDEDKMSQMSKAGYQIVRDDEVVATGKKLSPNTSYWLYATPVDKDGKYGPVSCVKATTSVLQYDNSITLTVEQVNVTAKKAELKVTSAGGDLSEYIYWFGRTTDPFWANTTYCGGTKTSAQKYLALNPDDENIRKAMNKYGEISSDGTIVMTDLTMETEYVFVILEKGDEYYSKVGYKKITTLAADLGEIVCEGTDAWNSAKGSVTIEWIESRFNQGSTNMMSEYAFNFNCPDNLTAYVMCASDGYFEAAGLTKVEHIMIEIENFSSRKYSLGGTPTVDGELATEPDYYKDGVLRNGQLVNVYEFYVHGVPSLGFVTYFAKDSHGEGNCIYWENGECAQYKAHEQTIARYLTLAPYEEKAAQFGLEGVEASNWAQALLETYRKYYENAKPHIYVNDGKGVLISTPYATGKNEEGVIPDRVIVMLKDLNGNYYEPMYFEVPDYFDE